MSAKVVDEGAAPAPLPQRRRRWLDTLNVLLVCGAIGLTFLGASPAILRAAGLVRPHPEALVHPAAGRLALPKPTGDAPARPFFDSPDNEDDDDREPSSGLVLPGHRSAEDRRRYREIFPGQRDPDDEPDRAAPRVHDPSPGAGDSRARIGLVRRQISLLEKPAAGARPLGEVPRGETVMVIKESGDYALVAYSGEEGVLMGWAKKSEIAVR